MTKMTRSGGDVEGTASSRAVAADTMGVSGGYVGLAKRVKEAASPELSEAVRAGDVTLPEAIRRLDGVTDDPWDDDCPGRCLGLVCGSPFRARNPGRVNQMYGTVEAPVCGLGVIAHLPLPCPVCPPTWWMGALSSIPVSPFTG